MATVAAEPAVARGEDPAHAAAGDLFADHVMAALDRSEQWVVALAGLNANRGLAGLHCSGRQRRVDGRGLRAGHERVLHGRAGVRGGRIVVGPGAVPDPCVVDHGQTLSVRRAVGSAARA